MRKMALILAAIMAAGAIHAADVEVPLGSVTVKEEAIPNVLEWLEEYANQLWTTERLVYNTYAGTNGTYTLTNEVSEVDELVSTTSRTRKVLVPESPVAQLRRLCRERGVNNVGAAYRSWVDAEAEAAALAAVEHEPDPIKEDD